MPAAVVNPIGYTAPTQPTIGANGYQNFITEPNFGTNPYPDQAAQYQGMANNAQTSNSIGALTSSYNSYAQTSGQGAGAYPSMPNAYNLGAQQSPPAMGNSGPTSSQAPLNITIPDASSRGFNPWSLQGEANSRK